MSSLAARGRHNFREQDTPNADSDRSGLNIIEGAKSTDELLKEVSDLLPSKRRKDAVIGLEYLITASPEHFGEWMKSENHGQDYFADAIKWLEEKHGKANVVCKTVHLDESTPHLAAFVVPLKDGKLNAKAFTGGAKVLAQMQTSFAVEVGAKHGLDRGVERSKAVHQDNAKIQPMTIERMHLRKRVQTLEAEVERLTKNVAGGGAALEAAKAEAEKSRTLMNNAMRLSVQEAKQIRELKQENETMKIEVKRATEAEKALVAEIENLRKHNPRAVATQAQLKAVDAVLIEQAGERIKATQEAAAKPLSVSDFHKKFAERTEEKRLQALEKMLVAAQTEPEYDRNALMDRWDANPATEAQQRMGTRGTIKAIEGPYIVQHIGKGVNVCLTLAKGVKAPREGSMVTIKGGQVVDAQVQERGGLSM